MDFQCKDVDFGLPQAVCVASWLAVGASAAALARGSRARRALLFGGDGDFGFSALEREHVTQASVGLLNIRGFAVCRLALGVFAIAVAVWAGLHDRWAGALGTFPGFSWICIGAYFLLAGAASATCCDRGPIHVIWVLFQVNLCVALFVTSAIYLAVIPMDYFTRGFEYVLQTHYSDPARVIMHHFNVLFMLLEARLNRMRVVRSHALFVVVYGSVYIAFSWALYLSSGGFWYFFMSWCDYSTAGVYWVLLLLLFCAFLAAEGLDARFNKEALVTLGPPQEFTQAHELDPDRRIRRGSITLKPPREVALSQDFTSSPRLSELAAPSRSRIDSMLPPETRRKSVEI